MLKGPRKFNFAFERSGLTRFGGLGLVWSFCRSLQIRRFLQVFVRWPDYDYRGYHPADLFLAHTFSIVAGLGRTKSTQYLAHNGLIPPLLGLNAFPHRHTLRSFLRRFDAASRRSLEAAHDKLRAVCGNSQGFLRDEQNPDPEFLGQRNLPGSDPRGLRIGPRVAKAVSASGSATLEHPHLAARALVASGRTGPAGTSQLAGSARPVSPARPFCKNPAGRDPSAPADLTNFTNARTRVLYKIEGC
jgi:hypothetical protein